MSYYVDIRISTHRHRCGVCVWGGCFMLMDNELGEAHRVILAHLCAAHLFSLNRQSMRGSDATDFLYNREVQLKRSR